MPSPRADGTTYRSATCAPRAAQCMSYTGSHETKPTGPPRPSTRRTRWPPVSLRTSRRSSSALRRSRSGSGGSGRATRGSSMTWILFPEVVRQQGREGRGILDGSTPNGHASLPIGLINKSTAGCPAAYHVFSFRSHKNETVQNIPQLPRSCQGY